MNMKRCTNCMRYAPIKYVGGENTYSYCYQGETYESCSGGECDYPDLFITKHPEKDAMTMEDIAEKLRKYVGVRYSSRELNIATYFYKLGVKQNKI